MKKLFIVTALLLATLGVTAQKKATFETLNEWLPRRNKVLHERYGVPINKLIDQVSANSGAIGSPKQREQKSALEWVPLLFLAFFIAALFRLNGTRKKEIKELRREFDVFREGLSVTVSSGRESEPG